MAQRRLTGLILLLALSLSPVIAAEPPAAAILGTPPQPGWSLLTAQQKAILAPLSASWESMDNLRRKKWLAIAHRYPGLKPDEQGRIRERMQEWAALTPEQRAKIRDSYKEFSRLPPEQKQAVKQKWEIYSNLPPDERERLRQGGKSGQLLTSRPPEIPGKASETPVQAETTQPLANKSQ